MAKPISDIMPLTRCRELLHPPANNVSPANAPIKSQKPRFPNKRKSSNVTSDDGIKIVHKRFKPSRPEKRRFPNKRKSDITSDDSIKTVHKRFRPTPSPNTTQVPILGDISNVTRKSVLSKYPTPRKMSYTKPSPKKRRACSVLRREEEVSTTNIPLRISESEEQWLDLSKATGVAHAGPESLALMKAQQAQANQATLVLTSKVAVEQFDLGVLNDEEPDLDFGVSENAEPATSAVDDVVEVETHHVNEELDLVFDGLNNVETETTDDVDAECTEKIDNRRESLVEDNDNEQVFDTSNDVEAEATTAAAEVDHGVIDNDEAEPTADVDAAVEVEIEAPPIGQPRTATRRVRMIRVSIAILFHYRRSFECAHSQTF